MRENQANIIMVRKKKKEKHIGALVSGGMCDYLGSNSDNELEDFEKAYHGK